MKNVKFLLFFFVCFLMACSEEKPIDLNDSNDAALRFKNGSNLTTEQVDYLKDKLSIIVLTQEWADKHAAIANFTAKMGSDTTEFTDRAHFETWLNEDGLSKTEFSSVNEGLEVFDYAVAKAELVINENLEFFELLSHADSKQAEVILEQLLIPAPEIVPNGGQCENACINNVGNCFDVVGVIYSSQVFVGSFIPDAYLQAGHLVFATRTYWTGMAICTASYNNCMGAC